MNQSSKAESTTTIHVAKNPDGKEMKIVSVHTEGEIQKKNVAAYARVSTLTDEQSESYETQVEYYRSFIGKNSNWNFVGVYADRGKSGLLAQNRPEFMRMINDAMEGKISIIITRSISRFARNSLEAQTYVRKLKEKCVEVRFEKEDISSFDPRAEMVFNFMVAIAQEESRSISENVRWTNKRLAEQGIRHLGNNRVLGYDEIKGVLTPNKDAWIIRLLFEEYAAGLTFVEIAKHINERGGRRLLKKDEFQGMDLPYLLDNEIYSGDRIIQKKPPKNYLTKRPDPNVAYESYFIENDHEPIVGRELWETVQRLRRKSKDDILKYGVGITFGTPMFGRIICGECGEPMLRKTAKVPNGYEKRWECRGRCHRSGCKNRIVSEVELFEIAAREIGIGSNEEINAKMLGDVRKISVYIDGHIEIEI